MTSKQVNMSLTLLQISTGSRTLIHIVDYAQKDISAVFPKRCATSLHRRKPRTVRVRVQTLAAATLLRTQLTRHCTQLPERTRLCRFVAISHRRMFAPSAFTRLPDASAFDALDTHARGRGRCDDGYCLARWTLSGGVHVLLLRYGACACRPATVGVSVVTSTAALLLLAHLSGLVENIIL